MQKRLCFAIAACLFSANAMAADWTGWYLGGHVGHGSGNSEADVSLGGQWSIESQGLRDFVASTWSTELEPSGTTYGVQFGYNHQFASNFVLGAELDYSQLDMDDQRVTGMVPVTDIGALTYNFGNAVELDNMFSLRAKTGYAFDRHLVYFTAGWAQVDAEAAAAVASNGGYLKAGWQSDRLDGIQWGAGYEFDFGNQWTVRAEYLLTDVDGLEYDTVYLPGSTFVDPAYTERVSQDVDFDVFRIGVNYRF